MRNLAQLKKDLEFNKSLTSFTEVLKIIAVTQFRSFELKLKTFERLRHVLENIIGSIDMAGIKHPFLTPERQESCVVAVTSDAGLMGGLNIQVANAAIQELEKNGGELAVIGERGQNYLRDRGARFASFPGVIEEERVNQAVEIRRWAMEKMSENCGRFVVVFPRALSITMQKVEAAQLLPFQISEKFVSQAKESSERDFIFESKPADVLEYLLKLWSGQKIYEIFGLSRLAEFAARFVHLEESSQRLKKLEQSLHRQYFRERHEIIDRGMRELFTARSLYARK